jgi:hypothetical protein
MASMLTTRLPVWPSNWIRWNLYLNLATYLIPPHSGEMMPCSPSHSQNRPSTNPTCALNMVAGRSWTFSSPRRPDPLWGPPSLLSNGYWGVKWPQCEADHLPICLHGILLNYLSRGMLPFTTTGNNLYRFNHKHCHYQNKNLTLQKPVLTSVHVKESPDYSFLFIMWLLDNQLKNITHSQVMKITGPLDNFAFTSWLCVANMTIPNTPLFQFLLRHFQDITPLSQLLQLKFHAITKIMMLQWHST